MPSKYRKKPVEVEAVQWDGGAGTAIPIINWILEGVGTATFHCEDETSCHNEDHVILISTLEGTMEAQPRDWIIKGVAGEFYPVKAEIFEQTYEKVE